MKCLKRPLIYVLNILFFISPIWGLVLTPEQLKKIAKEELAEKYPNVCLEDIFFFGNKLMLPNKPLNFNILKINTSYFFVIKDLISGDVVKQIPLKVKVKVKLPIATRNIPSGSIIRKKDFKWQIRCVSIFPIKIINPFGKRAVVYIQKGSIIKPSMLGNLFIPSGKKVKLIFKKGNLIIIATGTLITNGYVGNKVMVRRGKKIFEGFLKNETTVIIRLP